MTKKKTILQRIRADAKELLKLQELNDETQTRMRSLCDVTDELSMSPELFDRIKKLKWRLRRPHGAASITFRDAGFELATPVNCKAAKELWEMLVAASVFYQGDCVYYTAKLSGVHIQLKSQNPTQQLVVCARGAGVRDTVRGRKEIIIRVNNIGVRAEEVASVCEGLGVDATITPAVYEAAKNTVVSCKAAVEEAQKKYDGALALQKQIGVSKAKKKRAKRSS